MAEPFERAHGLESPFDSVSLFRIRDILMYPSAPLSFLRCTVLSLVLIWAITSEYASNIITWSRKYGAWILF
jgi:hypothetical protein